MQSDSAKAFQSGLLLGANMMECSGWAEIPRDVFQHLVLHLNTDEFCTLRLVSRTWASCSRQITTPPILIPSSQASLSAKIATLASWRQAGRFVNSKFSFQADKPMSVCELRKTTKALTQGCLTNCNILVQLRDNPDGVPSHKVNRSQQHLDAIETAEFAQQLLEESQVELCITVKRRSENTHLPAPEVVKALNCFLSVFDTYSVFTEQPAASLPQWICNYLGLFRCSHKQVTSLRYSNTQVCTLQVAVDIEESVKAEQEGQWSYDVLIADVATMTHLTKLHLSLTDCFDIEEINLGPLEGLTLLEDLALQYYDNPGCYWFFMCDAVCCQGVLTSNKHTLRRVTLTSNWTVATYNALQECSKLETLSIGICELDADQAQALASVSADSFRLTLHQQLKPSVLAAIRHSQPKVHMLNAWGTYQDQTLRLPEILSLPKLTLVNFVLFTVTRANHAYKISADMPGYRPFTGEELECCPMVTQLTLIDCPGLSSKGLKHIIEKALPALQALSIQASKKPESDFLCNCAHTVSFDADSLHALCLGSSLRSIDLRGVSGLTTELLLRFRAAFHSQQCRGDAPSSVELLLPRAACFDKAVFSVHTERSMFLPNIFRTSDCGEAEWLS